MSNEYVVIPSVQNPPVPAAPPAPMPEAAPTTPPPPPPAPNAYAPNAVGTHPDGKPMYDATGRETSPKSRLAAAILAWFLGVFGIHRFYAGKVGTGILMLVTFGGLGIWALIDFVMIVVGSFKDKQGRVLANW